MNRFAVWTIWAILTINTWILLIHLVVNIQVGNRGLAAPESLLTCALLIVAPAMIILPIASRLSAPFYDAEAILSWGTLGFIVVFFSPNDELTYGQFLAILLPLTVASATAIAPIAYTFVRRLRPARSKPSNVYQARRIGYLAALALVALMLLEGLALLSPFNGTLVIAVAVLAELIAGTYERGSVATSTDFSS